MLFRYSGFSFQRFVLLLGIISFAASTAYGQRINPKFTRYTINDGLSQGLIYSIIQDKQGFMWFGTKDGLNRFDGYEFKIFQHHPSDTTSIADNAIIALFTDTKGRLWIGTAHGELDLYDRKKDVFQHVLSVQPKAAAINVIVEDSSGRLWVGTNGNGIFELIFDSTGKSLLKKVNHYLPGNSDKSGLSSNFISNLFVDHKGLLWVSSPVNSFQYADLKRPEVKFKTLHLPISEAKKQAFPGGMRFTTARVETGKTGDLNLSHGAFVEDRYHRLWIGTVGGLFMLNSSRNKLFYFDLQRPGVKSLGVNSPCIVPSVNTQKGGSLWLGFANGVGVFTLQTFTFQFIESSPNTINGLLPGNVNRIYYDRSGCVWLGSNGYGLSKYNHHSSLFSLPEFETIDGKIKTGYLSMRSFLDTKRYLLLGTTQGLMVADKNTRRMKKVVFKKVPGAAHIIFSMALSDSESCWIGTNYGLVWYNFKNNTFKTYLPNASRGGKTDNHVFKLYNDGQGHIWCLNAHALSCFNIKQKVFKNYLYNNKPIIGYSEPAYGDIYEDAKGNFWLGTGDGLLYFDTTLKTFQHYVNVPSDSNSLSFDVVRCVLPGPKEPDKYLWAGTAGGGLNRFNLHTKKFTHYTAKDGLPNNVVYGILSDAKGNLWMSTNKGISKFDPSTGKFRNYTVREGLQSNEFNSGAFYKNSQGRLFFGGVNGFNAFYPKDIKDKPNIPQVVFTNFYLSNHSLSNRDKNSPLKYSINESKKIALPYKDNIIGLKIAGLDYANPDKNQYAYKLLPVNKKWVSMGNNRLITFSNLDPGKYVLKIKAANSDGLWSKKDSALNLVILPPWWQTWWAYLLYILILGTIIYLVSKHELKRITLRNRLQVEHIEAQKLRELDHLKSRFFANISHEFRTPLTLITGPLEDLLHGGEEKKFISLAPEMHRNSRRLLRLITQLLDLSKLDASRYQVNTLNEDIIPFVRKIFASFSSMATKKNISLKIEVEPILEDKLSNGAIRFYFDEDVIEKILTNLLSNAFKFTGEGGEISLVLKESEMEKGFLEIEVKDTGTGIPKEKISHIFDRFYQAGESPKMRYEGSGIGLALLKELVDLLQGKIEVESETGRGTTFRCFLPLNKRIISEHKKPTASVPFLSHIDETIPEEDEEVVPYQVADKTKNQVLVVEDNQDVRKYIREKLEDNYLIMEAKDGQKGLEIALAQIPDLVISDVMMPKMDGFELCKQLKTSDLTSHVPVILITALSEDSEKLRGLETGADGYLIKPFNSRELVVRVRNLITSRNKMRAKFSGSLFVKPAEITVTSLDRELIGKLLKAVDAHLDDTHFSVDDLSEAANMSTRQLNRKLKAIINQSPLQFIRSVRLQRAMEMLKNNSGNISEIAFKTGFETPSYFTKRFKEEFGCLPSEKEKFPQGG